MSNRNNTSRDAVAPPGIEYKQATLWLKHE